MCLIISEKKTKRLATRLDKKGHINCYKVVEIRHSDINLAYKFDEDILNSITNQYRWFWGLNHSNRKRTKIFKYEIKEKEVNKGFHVYLTKKSAEKNIPHYSPNVIITIRCEAKDFVAAGTNNGQSNGAVFNKVYLTEQNYKKAINHG